MILILKLRIFVRLNGRQIFFPGHGFPVSVVDMFPYLVTVYVGRRDKLIFFPSHLRIIFFSSQGRFQSSFDRYASFFPGNYGCFFLVTEKKKGGVGRNDSY